MNVQTMPLLAFVQQPDAAFSIPAYQRVYSWRERQCRELWVDLERAARKRREHFLGTILYSHEKSELPGQTHLSIIDGQQRLTTVMLLVCAPAITRASSRSRPPTRRRLRPSSSTRRCPRTFRARSAKTSPSSAR